MHIPIRPREVEAIRALDRAWRAFDAEQQQPRPPGAARRDDEDEKQPRRRSDA